MAEGTKPFEAVITIPKLVIKAKYTSSGVLIIIPASGGGDFNAVFGKNFFFDIIILIKWLDELIWWIFHLTAEGVIANVKGKMSTQEKQNGVYLHVDGLLLELIIKKPRLSVAKIFNNNRILSELTQKKEEIFQFAKVFPSKMC